VRQIAYQQTIANDAIFRTDDMPYGIIIIIIIINEED
jgi:hypothetical protein